MTAESKSKDAPSGPISLRTRALEDLRYIRATIDSANRYTTFSGKGLMLVGIGAVIAGALAARAPSELLRSRIWLVDAVVSVAVGALFGFLKAHVSEQSLRSAPIRKFTFSFAPVILAGAILTAALLRANAPQLLAGTWLCVYGAAVAAAGTSSVLPVPIMGVAFLVLGTLGLLGPPAWGNGLMIAGFGGLQVICGGVIAWRHGG